MEGVIPTNGLDFTVGTGGRNSTDEQKVTILEIESFTATVDGNIVEWNPMDTHGWVRRLMTGKSFSLSMSGKRHYGDKGNDYIASLAFALGHKVNTIFDITFPNGDKLEFDCIINVTTPFGGESTDPNSLEFEVQSDGEPRYIEKPVAG